MGEVWRAYHPGLKRDVAVKLLRPDRDPSLGQRFEREVQSTIQLSHPNTIRVFDYGITDDGISYYVMELLEGCTVRDLVAREGPLDARRARHLAMQAAGALAEAHDRGIVHRDVKPENIFVTTVGRIGDFAKILDFGIAKAINSEEGGGLTRTGIRMGTPGYIAPEILAGHEATAAADVYALGAVLHFMLLGTPPFQSENGHSLRSAQLEETRPSAPRRETVPTSLEAVVQRCLCPDPSARFTDAAAVLSALHACDDIGTWDPAPRLAAQPIEHASARGNTMPSHTATLSKTSQPKRSMNPDT
jgi:serine/threonine-protein kinase